MADAPRIGNLLVKDNKISIEQLEEGLKRQRDNGGNLGGHLIELGYISEDDLMEVLARQLGVKSIDLSSEEPDEDIINLIPAEVAVKFNILAFEKVGEILKVVISDPTNTFALNSIKLIIMYLVLD